MSGKYPSTTSIFDIGAINKASTPPTKIKHGECIPLHTGWLCVFSDVDLVLFPWIVEMRGGWLVAHLDDP